MKKILLTGGNGFIGKNIQESFLAHQYEIVAPRSFELNLIDTEAVDEYFKDKYFDAVLHCATKPNHRNAKDLTAILYSNLRMFENLERHKDCFGKLINFGSGAIYDMNADNFNVKESEIYTRLGSDEHSFCKYIQQKLIDNLDNFVNFNIFGIFGKYEDWEIRFISNAICKTLFNLPITLRQNRRFSYLDVMDLMPIIEFFIENNTKYKSYNIVPDNNTELLEIAGMILEISGKDLEIKVARDGYGLNYTGDNARLKAEMPDVRFTDIRTSIKNLYRYYETHKENLDRNLLLQDK